MTKQNTPWIEIKNMRDEMDRIMNETLNLKPCPGKGSNRFSLWQPVADLYETPSHIIIEMELPGVLQENISLEAQGEHLSVFGEKKLEKDASGSAYHVLERSYGPFSRSFVLPDYAESSEISAVFRNGILVVTIPKSDAKKKTYNIQIG